MNAIAATEPLPAPMLRSLKEVLGYRIRAIDADLGKLRDAYFDDRSWFTRYFVVDTGSWLPGRKVLISPVAFAHPDWKEGVVPTNLTSDQVKDSPDVDAAKPVSQEQEQELHRYYGWPMHWAGVAIPGTLIASPHPVDSGSGAREDKRTENHLRSAREVMGYAIEAVDGDIGHVEDFIVEERSWTIRYLVVDTRNWLPGRKVLVATPWVRQIDHGGMKVRVDLERERVRKSPGFDPEAPVNRAYEERLYDFYGRPYYWKQKA